IVAVDLSEEMLRVAQCNVERAGMANRIRLERVNARGLHFPDRHFPAVISNSIIHHIPEPRDCFTEMVRVCEIGGTLFIRDLLRPPTKKILDQLVATYAGDASPHQRQLFADSLHAALTLEEVRALIASLGFDDETVQQTSDRHWTWIGVRR